MKQIVLSFVMLFAIQFLFAQEELVFTVIKENPHTGAKNQQQAGTCWSFATTSFVESELMRIGEKEMDLSELFFVYYAYVMKMENYIRLHGTANFSQGGQAHEVFMILDEYGAMPESAFDGYAPGDDVYNHTEMESVLHSMAKVYAKNKKPGKYWKDATMAILDIYMGIMPDKFNYKKADYDAVSFRKEMVPLKSDDYVQITSFTHHPFYSRFRLEIPDNWLGFPYYNVTLDEMMEIIDYAIENGFTIAWDGDVSEEGFDHRAGYAILGEDDPKPTQENRQQLFDDFLSTDDHLMHLVGISKDEDGNKYYIIKNSWGTKLNDYEGLLHMSEDYVKLKTISLFLHKDAIPKEIREKIGL
ncbi:MAG: aminopeptidase [Marinilabiliales bacterium]|nr:MAG: aminopeptidase [Marinilabiliales bacterium]